MWIFVTWVVCIIILISGEFLLIKSHDRRWAAGIRELNARETALRIYDLCERMKHSTAILQATVHENTSAPLPDGDVDKQDDFHAASYPEAQKVIAQVEGQVLIDPIAKPFREPYSELWNAFNEYVIADLYEPPGIGHTKKIFSLEQKIDELSIEVRSLAENHLERLDTLADLTEIPEHLWSCKPEQFIDLIFSEKSTVLSR